MAYTSVGSIEPDPMIERILLLKQEAYVYKIPPAQVLMNVLTCLCESKEIGSFKTLHYFLGGVKILY